MWNLHQKKVTNHGLCDCTNIYKADTQADGRALKSGIFCVFITGIAIWKQLWNDVKKVSKMCSLKSLEVWYLHLNFIHTCIGDFILSHVNKYSIINSLDVFSSLENSIGFKDATISCSLMKANQNERMIQTGGCRGRGD